MTHDLSIELGNILFNNDLSYNEEAKDKFHRIAKKWAKSIAIRMGMVDYDIRSNKGGIAVSGEVTLHAHNIYIQVSQSCMAMRSVLYRKCNGKKDYTGGINNFLNDNDLLKGQEFVVAKFQQLINNNY